MGVLRGHRGSFKLRVIAVLGFGGRNVSDGLEKPAAAEPVDPFECCELDRLEAAPRSAPMNDFGLVEADHRLGERVVVRVADAADGGVDPFIDQALGVFDRNELHAAIAVTDEAAC